MIQQNQFSAMRGAVDKDVARVGVAMHVTLHKDHLTVKFSQLPGHLHRHIQFTFTPCADWLFVNLLNSLQIYSKKGTYKHISFWLVI